MTTSDKLDLFISEYLNEPDKKRIQNISIFIPGHNGHFWIIDAACLSFDLATLTFKPVETFTLAIYFSFSDRSRKGKSLIEKINKSECFKDFSIKADSRRLTYFLDKYIDKKKIINKIENITISLFPNVDYNDINVELKRLDDWLTIEEKGSA